MIEGKKYYTILRSGDLVHKNCRQATESSLQSSTAWPCMLTQPNQLLVKCVNSSFPGLYRC